MWTVVNLWNMTDGDKYLVENVYVRFLQCWWRRRCTMGSFDGVLGADRADWGRECTGKLTGKSTRSTGCRESLLGAEIVQVNWLGSPHGVLDIDKVRSTDIPDSFNVALCLTWLSLLLLQAKQSLVVYQKTPNVQQAQVAHHKVKCWFGLSQKNFSLTARYQVYPCIMYMYLYRIYPL